MTQPLAKVFDPASSEERWYRSWEESGYFGSKIDPTKTPFSITIPPPNVTGELHMGHAIQHAIHDMVIRWKRMQGYETLCLPGTDHAGIATQMKVEEELSRTEGKNRYDLGRDAFIERVWQWKDRYGTTIYDQLRRLGCSYDWERARFTLDEAYVEAVLKAFQQFYERGWIYRGRRMINWCPNCRTVISDLETEELELQGHLWHITYPGVDGGPDVVVATTRPETMLGDAAVAVHPDDARWKAAVGKSVMLPLMARPIPIVADEYADPEMGSGAVKVTPAHDPNDYEVGERHGLEQLQVIDFDGTMNSAAGNFSGLDRYACREAVLAALQREDLIVKVEDHVHAVPHHDKCGAVIEPLPMEQWFMKMEELAARTAPILENEKISYRPDRFRGYALEWLQNIRDWALSRQIWWGHRIPAWYCASCSRSGLLALDDIPYETALREGNFRVALEEGAVAIVSAEKPKECPECGGADLVQDPDVLDTWFSSALWPFATLGWPQKSEDLAYYHPTDLMITGRDILYLWVLRMVMTAGEFVGEIPFKMVYVHPTVLTRDGKRMSKSLGTGLNPLDLVRLYGADATRYSLLHQVGSTQDVRFDAEVENNVVLSSPSAENGRNFCNKLWNAARFVLMNLADYTPSTESGVGEALADRWIRSRMAGTIRDVNTALDSYKLSEVTRAVYDFIWRDYCDWYVEICKTSLQRGDAETRRSAQAGLVQILETALRLMHPIMPFITEVLWQALPKDSTAPASLMICDWPAFPEDDLDDGAEKMMSQLQQVVTAVRTIRSESNISPGKRIELVVSCADEDLVGLYAEQRGLLEDLVKAEAVTVGHDLPQPAGSGGASVGDVSVYVPLEGIIDLAGERKRLEKEVSKFQGLVRGMAAKLGNRGFLENAPAEVVDREYKRRDEYEASLAKLEASLDLLGSHS
jgi:valyl-tRNA synthetase